MGKKSLSETMRDFINSLSSGSEKWAQKIINHDKKRIVEGCHEGMMGRPKSLPTYNPSYEDCHPFMGRGPSSRDQDSKPVFDNLQKAFKVLECHGIAVPQQVGEAEELDEDHKWADGADPDTRMGRLRISCHKPGCHSRD